MVSVSHEHLGATSSDDAPCASIGVGMENVQRCFFFFFCELFLLLDFFGNSVFFLQVFFFFERRQVPAGVESLLGVDERGKGVLAHGGGGARSPQGLRPWRRHPSGNRRVELWKNVGRNASINQKTLKAQDAREMGR